MESGIILNITTLNSRCTALCWNIYIYICVCGRIYDSNMEIQTCLLEIFFNVQHSEWRIFLISPGTDFGEFTNNLSGYQDYSEDNNKLRQKVIAGDLEFGWFSCFSREMFYIKSRVECHAATTLVNKFSAVFDIYCWPLSVDKTFFYKVSHNLHKYFLK